MFATCARGHGIHSGELALFVRAGYLKSVWCVEHAREQYGSEPPPPAPFEPGDEDAKTRSGGN
jgi:hypothetical protein